MTFSGLLSYEVSLNAASYLAKETEYAPWDTATDSLGYLESMFSFQSDYETFKVRTF